MLVFSWRGWAGSHSPFPRKRRLPWWERGRAVGLSATTEPLLRGCTGFSAFPCGQGQVWGCFVPLKEQGELSQGLMGMGVESLLRVRAGTTSRALRDLLVRCQEGWICGSSASCLLCPGFELDVWEGKAQGGPAASACGSAPLRPCPLAMAARKARMGLG